MKNKLIHLISNLVLVLITVATIVYHNVAVVVNKGIIYHTPFVWSSINWIDVLFIFLFLLLFVSPNILYICGSWFENLSKPMKITHSMFMVLGTSELFFVFYNNMQVMGLVSSWDLSENEMFCMCIIPLMFICLYSLSVLIVRIIRWIIQLSKK